MKWYNDAYSLAGMTITITICLILLIATVAGSIQTVSCK